MCVCVGGRTFVVSQNEELHLVRNGQKGLGFLKEWRPTVASLDACDFSSRVARPARHGGQEWPEL